VWTILSTLKGRGALTTLRLPMHLPMHPRMSNMSKGQRAAWGGTVQGWWRARRTWAQALQVLATVFATAALAYVMPSGSILRRLANARDELSLGSLRVDGSATFYGAGARDAAAALGLATDRAEVQVDAVVMLRAPGRCRFELNPLDGSRAASVVSGDKARREGRELSLVEVALARTCAVLATRSDREGDAREVLQTYLREHRVDLSTTSLSRLNGQVAFVMGSPEQGKPQFWAYKDSFMPARIRFPEGGVAWDVRFLDYGSPATGEAFPRTVEVWREGALVMRFTALKSDAKATFGERTF